MPINTLPDSLQPDDCSDELRRADDLRENKKKTEEATLSTARRVLLRLQRLGGPALPALECPLSGEPRFMAPGCGGRQQLHPPSLIYPKMSWVQHFVSRKPLRSRTAVRGHPARAASSTRAALPTPLPPPQSEPARAPQCITHTNVCIMPRRRSSI